MGIPAFYSWLAQKYSRITRKHLPDRGLDHLYVDVNGLIHGACQTAGGDYMKDEGKMLERLILYIERLMKLVEGKGVVYLAVDGVAPRAKLNQQRGRRFQSAKLRQIEGNHDDLAGMFEGDDHAEVKSTKKDLDDATEGLNMGIFDKSDIVEALREDEAEVDPANIFCFDLPSEPTDDTPLWDSNSITPGTSFMKKVAAELNNWAATTYPGPCTVIVSDSNTPGEGEHKFIDFLKLEKNSPWYNPEETHGIVSLDADIILLSLSLHIPNVFIVREDRWAEGMTKFDYVFVDNLREQLAEELFGKIAHYKKQYNTESTPLPDFSRVLNDWISLMTLAGNDFLPHLPAAYIGQLSGDLFMDIYERLQAESPDSYLLNPDCTVNLKNLVKFLKKYSEVEDSLFRQEAIFDEHVSEAQVEEAGGYLSPIDDVWRKVYYNSVKTVSSEAGTTEEMQQGMAKNWLEGYKWVLEYYMKPGTVSWEWFYPYYHAPFAREIIDFIEKGGSWGECLTVPSAPLQPKQQLLSVLPSWSFSLLPEGFGASYTTAHPTWYPTGWKFDLTGCRAEHHGVPVLPFLDVGELQKHTADVPVENNETDKIYGPPLRLSHHVVVGGDIVLRYRRGDFEALPSWNTDTPHPKVASLDNPEHIPWRDTPLTQSDRSLMELVSTPNACVAGGVVGVLLLLKGKRLGLVLVVMAVVRWVVMRKKKRLDEKRAGRRTAKKPAYLKPKRCRVDWICPRCLCKNWERQQTCFRCEGDHDPRDTIIYLPKSNRWSTSCYKSNHLEFVEEQ